MSVVSEEELTVAAVARRLGLSRQAVQRVANDLRDVGYLESRANPGDGRAPLFSLTPRGRARAQLLAKSGLDREDLQRARGTLQRLLQAYAGTGGNFAEAADSDER